MLPCRFHVFSEVFNRGGRSSPTQTVLTVAKCPQHQAPWRGHRLSKVHKEMRINIVDG